MKRNDRRFLSALLAIGLGLALSPCALAQYGMAPAQDQPAEQDKQDVPSPEAGAKMTEALVAEFPDAAVTAFKKTMTVGTNDIYAILFTAKGGNKMRGIIATDGTILETEEPADIKTFPGPANDAVRKAITGMGVKDLGVRLGRTYCEIQKSSGTNDSSIVKLSTPLLTYRADVQNNKGESGKFSFKGDGSAVEKPSWAQ